MATRDAKIQACSTYSSIHGTMATLVFAALVVYISFAERTAFCPLQYITVCILLTTSIWTILCAFLYTGAIDDFVCWKDKSGDRKKDMADTLSAFSLLFFFLCLALISFNINQMFGGIVSLILFIILILWIKI